MWHQDDIFRKMVRILKKIAPRKLPTITIFMSVLKVGSVQFFKFPRGIMVQVHYDKNGNRYNDIAIITLRCNCRMISPPQATLKEVFFKKPADNRPIGRFLLQTAPVCNVVKAF